MVQRHLFLVVTVEFARWVPPRQIDADAKKLERGDGIVVSKQNYLKKQKLARLFISHAFTSNSDRLSAGIVWLLNID